jgi:hypothetical protein
VSFPPHLLDELARVFAREALERLLQESAGAGAAPKGCEWRFL